MQMSPEYFLATTAHLESKGFARQTIEDPAEMLGGCVVGVMRQVLERGDRKLIFDLVRDQGGGVRYFLELDWSGASTFSLQLDTWKHWPDRLEVKFVATPDTGLALSIRLRW